MSTMTDGNTAALSTYMAQQDKAIEPIEAHEEAAIEAIVDDLLLGYCYPRNGRKAVDAGCFLREVLDDDDLDNVLSAVVCGRGEMFDRNQELCETLFREGFPAWLRANRPDLLEMKVEELIQQEHEEREEG